MHKILIFILFFIAFSSAEAHDFNREDRKQFRKGMRNFYSENYTESLYYFKKIVYKYDYNFDVVYYYGVSLLKTKAIDESVYYLEKAIEMIPYAVPSAVYFDLAKIYYHKGVMLKSKEFAKWAVNSVEYDDEFAKDYVKFYNQIKNSEDLTVKSEL